MGFRADNKVRNLQQRRVLSASEVFIPLKNQNKNPGSFKQK